MELARRIIRNITNLGTSPACGNGVNEDFMRSLASESKALRDKREMSFFGLRSRDDIAYSAAKRMVERIYRLYEPYCLELDHIIGPGGFKIACTVPDEISETVDENWPFKPPEILSFYRARFSTNRLSIIVRAHRDRVEFFIIPVEFVMMLSKGEDSYGALMSFNAVTLQNSIEWEVENKPLTDDRFERYCLLLLEYFVKQHQREEELYHRSGYRI